MTKNKEREKKAHRSPEYHRKPRTDGRLFAREKPDECSGCYFWRDKRHGCILGGEENCYYLLREPDRKPSPCDGCPYGRGQTCAFCMKRVLGQGGIET